MTRRLLAVASGMIITSAAHAGTFPPDFKWCVATAAHQIEGGNTESDWWLWEQIPGRIKNGDRSGPACDHWNRVAEDIGLMNFLGVKTYRFSVEWAKIEPREGHFDEAALDHYERELLALRAAGIEPLVTLNHFTLPLWVALKGGWDWEGIPGAFQKYTAKVYDRLGYQVRDWVTLNEPTVILVAGYVSGVFPPGIGNPLQLVVGPMERMLIAHRNAYHTLHGMARSQSREVRVGIAHHLRIFDPQSSWNPLDHLASKILADLFNWTLPEATRTGVFKVSVPFLINHKRRIANLAGTEDFFGLNYYTRDRVSIAPWKPEFFIRGVTSGAPVSDMGWELYPKGIYRLLKEVSKRYPKPIMITENGLADAADSKRAAFLNDHLAQVKQAMDEGAPVEGYCHWSLMDNFEWAEGFTPRFGLFEMDYRTLERKARPSAELFRRYANGD